MTSPGCSGCILLITSLGLTADLIGDQVQSGALIYGLMSLTDKISNGLAVLLIQAEIPCLPVFSVGKLYLELQQYVTLYTPTTSDPCESCTQPPVPAPSTVSPTTSNNPCYEFYKLVLTITTSSTSLFGALFVVLLLCLNKYRKQKIIKNDEKESCKA